jgi:hypothetical protein
MATTLSVTRLLCLFLLVGCLLLAGCVDRTRSAEVAGKVKFEGKSLSEGLVTFLPTAGVGPEFSATVAEGKYRVPICVLPGKYGVEVRAWRQTGRMITIPYGGGETAEKVSIIPQRYAGPKSTLSADLRAGLNQVDFDLTP